jgi:group II intron reverse transcriptase/maturase/CRISPR-associated endonuclease Cas1
MATTPLYDRLCEYGTLWQAWKIVKAKNTAGGVDAISVKEFAVNAAQEVERIRNELLSFRYIPEPYRSTNIPKSKGGFRQLGLLCVRDKIVQQAINSIIYPLVDSRLSSACYAYRKGKGAIQAVGQLKRHIHQKSFHNIVSCDIKAYFDNIDHDLLFSMLDPLLNDGKMLDMIALSIKMGKVKKGNIWVDREKGVPQGGVISPILSNLYLTALDEAILHHEYGYVRYADDFVILTSNREEAEHSVKIISDRLSALKLSLKAPAEVYELSKGFTFLGIDFFHDQIELGSPKKTRIREKLTKEFALAPPGFPNILNKTLNGYRAFYAKILLHEQLAFIDEFITSKFQEKAKDLNISSKNQLLELFGSISFVTDDFERQRHSLIDQIFTEIRKPKPPSLPETAKLINKKKKEYQKIESQGKELIINSFGVYLGTRDGRVLIRNKERREERISFTNLTHITILTNGVSLSSDLLYHCAKNQVPVSFFTRTGQHYATLHSPFGTDNSLWNKQMELTELPKGREIAAKIVDAKIRNQSNLMKYFHKYHKHNDSAFANLFQQKVNKFPQFIEQCKTFDLSDKHGYRQKLMGIEAQAAMNYWQLVQELINDDSDFAGRERRGAKDLVNGMLNYGYAILYARVWKALLGAKLNPYISYLHMSDTSKPTLVFDFIEMFRQQAVDRVVISILQKKEKMTLGNDGLLDKDTRSKLISNIYERLHRYEKYRGESRRFSDIINIQAFDLANFIRAELKTFKPYIAKW